MPFVTNVPCVYRQEKSEEFQNAFASPGSSKFVEEPIVKCLEKFVCYMYSKPKLNSVDEARLELFADKYKQKPGKPLSLYSLGNIDSTS